MIDCCEHFLLVEAETPIVQEIHICVGHLFCSLIDYYLFEGVGEIQAEIAPEAFE
jgi:D-sedoheptulose 7-phosphate isomerase